LPSLAFKAPEPLRLRGFKVDGISGNPAKAGEQVQLWTRFTLTSDDKYFHRIAENLMSVLDHCASQNGKPQDFRRANSVLIITNRMHQARLWVDSAPIIANILLKRSVQAGEPVFEKDIGDVVGLDFSDISIGKNDKLIFLFREGWRFALFCDFNDNRKFDRPRMVRTLGNLLRNMRYREIYSAVEDRGLLDALISAGWFPFVEIIGAEVKPLLSNIEAGFDLEHFESTLIDSFDEARMERMMQRWMTKPHYASKEKILRSAINNYLNGDPIASIKTSVTEIEGVLFEAYQSKCGKSAKWNKLVDFAVESASSKTPGENTLMFPEAFGEYLRRHTFLSFDPSTGAGTAGMRNAVGHGKAAAQSYTSARALQSLLTLDQLSFYT
jgi:hypothetical protein